MSVGAAGLRLATRGGAWSVGAVEGREDGFQLEAQKARGDAQGRDSTLAREATHGRLAHLEEFGKLARRQNLLARR